MATVIFSNMGDTDTAVLVNIWKGMKDVNVIEVNRMTKNGREMVDNAIAKETDTLIMCGHGTPSGLLNPSWTTPYLVDNQNKHLIRARRVIGIWCHAKDFAERQNVRGFFSSMFISNSGEARMNGICTVSGKSITDEEILFCNRLNRLIKSSISMNGWVDRLVEQADYTNPVVKFNYDGLRFYSRHHKFQINNCSVKNILKNESARWGHNLISKQSFVNNNSNNSGLKNTQNLLYYRHNEWRITMFNFFKKKFPTAKHARKNVEETKKKLMKQLLNNELKYIKMRIKNEITKTNFSVDISVNPTLVVDINEYLTKRGYVCNYSSKDQIMTISW